jgi:hypothetical protein
MLCWLNGSIYLLLVTIEQPSERARNNSDPIIIACLLAGLIILLFGRNDYNKTFD